MKVVIINQARMTSTRLPGKILLPVMNKSLLEYQIERLKKVKLADDLVIATTTNDADQPVVDLCRKLNVPCYRGSENDVLSRYYEAAIEYQADTIVRVTSDCPLIDPEIIDGLIAAYNNQPGGADYVSNNLQPSYPLGMDAEVFPFRVLKQACEEAVHSEEREHVMPFVYLRPRRFKLLNVFNDIDYSHYRLTVDTREDFELIRKILEAVYPVNPEFKMDDIINLLLANPEMTTINAHVEQTRLVLEEKGVEN